jgi:hypothetical protein
LISVNKKFHELGGAGSGKFPIGRKVGIVNGNIVGMPFDAQVLAAGSQDRRQAIDGIDRRSAHGRSATIIKTDFTKADDETFFSGFDIDDTTSDFGCERFFELRLNVLERSGGRGGAQDAFGGLNEPLHIEGPLDVFNGLHLGERNGFAVA